MKQTIGYALMTALLGASALGFTGEAHAKSGWQTPFLFNVPTGVKDLFFHMACPADFPVPVNGGFRAVNAVTKQGLTLVGNFRRDDAPGTGNEWGWIIDWPAGAPAGSQIIFNVYCKAK